MKKLIIALACLLLVAGYASSADLATYNATYQKSLGDIVLAHSMTITDLGGQYTKALDGLLAAVKKTGDLDKTTSIMEEIERFRKEKAMPKTISATPEITALQSSFRRQASTHEARKAKSLISLATKYDKALERLQKSLVSTSKIADAKAVQAERRSVQQSSTVTAAKASIARHRNASRNNTSSRDSNIKKVLPRPSYGNNLLKNSSNEAPAIPGQIPDWDAVSGNTWTHRAEDPAPKEGGVYFFAGSVAAAELKQDVDVAAYGSGIKRGRQKFRFEGYLSSWRGADAPRIVIEYLDQTKKQVLDSYDSGERKSSATWNRIQHKQAAPKNTCFIRVRLIAKRYDGANNDAYFDALSLKAIK